MDEIQKCLNCNSTDYTLLFRLPSPEKSPFSINALHWNVPDSLKAIEFSVVQCRNCHLVFATPQPSLNELSEYYSKYAEGSRLWTEAEKRFNTVISSILTRYKKTGKILDIGCGYGLFLHKMHKKGFECFGVEQVPSAEKYIRENFSFHFFYGSIEEFLSKNKDCFDIVSLLNVLEHLKEPKEVLNESYQRLNKQGLLTIVVPNAQLQLSLGKIRKLFKSTDPYFQKTGKHMVAIGPPHHLVSFTPNTLRSMIESVGFKVVRIIPAPVIPNIGHPIRTLFKYLLYFWGYTVCKITFESVNFGYSMLCIARKS